MVSRRTRARGLGPNMSFIVIVFTCLMGIHGQSCKPWQEPGVREYVTYQECERKARAMTEDIREAGPTRWGMGAVNDGVRVQVKAFCMIRVIDEVVLG